MHLSQSYNNAITVVLAGCDLPFLAITMTRRGLDRLYKSRPCQIHDLPSVELQTPERNK